MEIEVIGLGYVGYPLALQVASKGFRVIGVDYNNRILSAIKQKKSPVTVDDHINSLINSVDIDVSSEVIPADVFIVCVPTPVKKKSLPDLSYVLEAVRSIAKVVKDGDLIVIESTIYPGVCDDILLPILEETGKKIHLAHCPERINPGDKKWNVGNIPRVAGGNSQESTKMAIEFYRSVIDAEIIPVSQLKAAEATKILENTFRDINIAFINEMAQSFYRLGIDVKEVIKGAASKPFAFMPHYPGIGVGGHCIAVDPYYMIEKGKEVGFEHDFLTLARRINSKMPDFTVDIIQDGLNEIGKCLNGAKITILGLSYKPNVGDKRESPSLIVIELLKEKMAEIHTYDPYFLEDSTEKTLEEAINGSDCVLLATAHDDFISDPEIYTGVPLLVDGRNILDKQYISSLGVLYKGVGIK